MAREIQLTRGYVALVDDEDYERVVTSGPWHVLIADPDSVIRYARHTWQDPNTKRTHGIVLHKFLTGWPLCDHINGNGLDNRRANLRPATASQNMANRRRNTRNQAGYKGVVPTVSGRWAARCANRHVGTFDTPEAAARAYDQVALATWGDYARPNFPREDYAA